MKKLVSLSLVLILALSLLAACGQTAPSSSQAPASEAASSEAAPASEAASSEAAPASEAASSEEAPAEEGGESWKEEHPGWLCEEKQTLSVYTWEGVSSSFLPPSNDLFFWQWMEDYTNVHIEWEVVPYADYSTLIAAKLSSPEKLNDIVNMGASAQTALSAGQNGMMVDFSEHWYDWFPCMSKMYDDMGIPYAQNVTNYDGSMYAITTFAAPRFNRIILLYNLPWLEQLGLEIPKTVDEFTECLRAIKAAGDLNGNGQDDEIPFTATSVEWLLPAIGTAFGVENIESCDFFSADENGVVFPEYTSDNMKAMLGWLGDIYQEGLLDAEIATNTMDIVAEKVTAERVAVVAMYASFCGSYSNLTKAGQETPNSEIYTIGYPLTSELAPTPKMTMYENYGMFTGVSTDCENPELAARWLDALYADDNVMLVRCCGKPGETFEVDENGEPKIIMPADGSAWTIKNLGCGQLSLPYIQSDLQLTFSAKATRPWYIEKYTEHFFDYAEWAMPSVPKVPGYTEEETEIRDLYQADLKAGWEEYRDKFITGALDVDKDWEAYTKTLEQLGMNEMCKCYQSVYDRTR